VARTGVHSLKIEGRTRSPYYVAQVVRGYRLALDAIARGEGVPREAVEAVLATDSRGWMSGFYTSDDPMPQLVDKGREGRLSAEVVGQVREWKGGRARISVRNRIATGERLELLTVSGVVALVATNLVNQRGEPTERLHPGLEDCWLDMPEAPGEWSFLVRQLHD
jgi:putative protease